MDNVRQAITIYTRWRNPETDMVKPVRRVLLNCFYGETEAETVYRTGNVPSQAIMCQVFIDNKTKYIEPHIWQKTPYDLLDGKWTSRGTDLLQTHIIIVPYMVDFEFDWARNPQQAENTFIGNTPNAVRVASVQNNMRGSRRSQHILFRAGLT